MQIFFPSRLLKKGALLSDVFFSKLIEKRSLIIVGVIKGLNLDVLNLLRLLFFDGKGCQSSLEDLICGGFLRKRGQVSV